MIIVDTSVWVAVLRSNHAPEAGILASLIDADEVALPAPVRIELLSGASRRNMTQLRRQLSALPILYPTDETWTTLHRWIERAIDAGQRFGVGDLLVAALADEVGRLIWSLDQDFERMAKLKLIGLYG